MRRVFESNSDVFWTFFTVFTAEVNADYGALLRIYIRIGSKLSDEFARVETLQQSLSATIPGKNIVTPLRSLFYDLPFDSMSAIWRAIAYGFHIEGRIVIHDSA